MLNIHDNAFYVDTESMSFVPIFIQYIILYFIILYYIILSIDSIGIQKRNYPH